MNLRKYRPKFRCLSHKFSIQPSSGFFFQRHLHSTHKHTIEGSNCKNCTCAVVEYSTCNYRCCPCRGSVDTVKLPRQGNKGCSTMHSTPMYVPLFPHIQSLYLVCRSHQQGSVMQPSDTFRPRGVSDSCRVAPPHKVDGSAVDLLSG